MKKQDILKKANPYLISLFGGFDAGYILCWAFFWLDDQRPKVTDGRGFVYDYQTLISAFFIIIAAFIGICVPLISQRQRISEERNAFANKAHYLAAICMSQIALIKEDDSLKNIYYCCSEFKDADFDFFTNQMPIFFTTREIMTFDHAKNKLNKARRIAGKVCVLIDKTPKDYDRIARNKVLNYTKFLHSIIKNIDYICPELELSKKNY